VILRDDAEDNWRTAPTDGDESPVGGDSDLVNCWGSELREPVRPRWARR